MIKINNELVKVSHFPDGTQKLNINYNYNDSKYFINWNYDNDEEMITLYYIVSHLRLEKIEYLSLYMAYCPNARMDRTHERNEVFTLKYFANFINFLGFDKVYIENPHSDVCVALINNCTAVDITDDVEEVDAMIDDENLTYFYPDAGAMKRYNKMFTRPYVYGTKVRDWNIGNILGLEVIGDPDLIAGKNILIIDDICSKGGTFYHSAKRLKELGAKDIYLYITHCENTILEGDLINSGLVKHIFTTDSIFTKEHPLISIITN